MKIIFFWKHKGYELERTMFDKSYEEALAIVKTDGYVEPRWYKPWSWDNGVVVTWIPVDKVQ